MLVALPVSAAPGDPSAYVRARAAAAEGAVDTAAAGYTLALAAAPDDPVVAIRAYREGLDAGDLDLARRAAATLVKFNAAPADAAILAFADAAHGGDVAAADAAIERLSKGPLDFMTPVLRAWLAEEQGRDPLPLIEAEQKSALARRYTAEHRALLLIASGRIQPGVAALRTLLGTDFDGPDLRYDAARLLVFRKQRDLAYSLFGGEHKELKAQLGKGAKPSAAFGAGRLFTRIASDLARQDTRPMSIALTRAALLLDPHNDEARLLLADALSSGGSHDRALALLKEVPADSLFARRRDIAMVTVLARAGKDDAAIDHARALAHSPDANERDAQVYGDLLTDQHRFAEAAAAYGDAITRAGDSASWILHLQKGSALERANRWDEALPELKKAVELAPDQPAALNYLGYAQAERGENLAEAQEMLEHARRLQPDSAPITDSLAWAYFQRGQVDKALPLLEAAAKAEPSNSTINEHLGDVYWAVGRHYEARYAWRAAEIYADGKDAERLTAKIASGAAFATR
jgi:tetratricopeptide (TPR) repeat protein